jgi:hypothetical protein
MNIENAWRPFEPSREAVDEARRESDERRCAVCGWKMQGHGPGATTCYPGSCSFRPQPEYLFAPERAEREAQEARELHQRALRNGMPPSGRLA